MTKNSIIGKTVEKQENGFLPFEDQIFVKAQTIVKVVRYAIVPSVPGLDELHFVGNKTSP